MFTKLLEIQKLLIKVKKDGKNPHFKSKYITLDGLLETILPLCNDRDILIRHATKDQEVVTTITDGNEELVSSFPIGDISNPQKIGSAITYAKRYNLGQLFNIVTDEDDDGNKASEDTKKEATKEDKKVFDDKKMKAMYTRAVGKSKGEVMQEVLKIQKTYTMSDEIKADMDLFLETIK